MTVRLTGVNAAIILVRGDVNIDSGGRLLARGDGSGGAPNSNGTNGALGTISTTPAGGIGVAGAGDGGLANNDSGSGSTVYGGNGVRRLRVAQRVRVARASAARRSPVLAGAGRGAVGTFLLTSTNPGANRISPGGGGGGHAAVGNPGSNTGTDGAMTILMNAFVDGAGGGTYGDISQQDADGRGGLGRRRRRSRLRRFLLHRQHDVPGHRRRGRRGRRLRRPDDHGRHQDLRHDRRRGQPRRRRRRPATRAARPSTAAPAAAAAARAAASAS